MSTSGAATPSCWKGKGSNERPSNTGACNIATPLPNIINQVSQSLRYFRPLPVSNHLTTDTYLKVIGWGWFYLSTILDDFSRYIIAWKLCTTMRTEDVTDTLELALKASGCDQAKVVHKPRLLSDNGSSYISGDLARMAR